MKQKIEVELGKEAGRGITRALDDEPNYTFVPDKCYIPTRGNLGDLFNDNFKLYANASLPTGPVTFYVNISWKGTEYLYFGIDASCEHYPCEGPIVLTWESIGNVEEPPTIKEFLERWREPEPEETTEYSYTWLGGYITSSDDYEQTTSMDSMLLVEVKPFPWQYVIPAVAGVAVATGVVIAIRKK